MYEINDEQLADKWALPRIKCAFTKLAAVFSRMIDDVLHLGPVRHDVVITICVKHLWMQWSFKKLAAEGDMCWVCTANNAVSQATLMCSGTLLHQRLVTSK